MGIRADTTPSIISIDFPSKGEDEPLKRDGRLKKKRNEEKEEEEALPDHLLQFKADFKHMNDSRIKLPVLRVMSPQALRRVRELPPPSEAEQAIMAEYASLTTRFSTTESSQSGEQRGSSIYSELQKLSDKQRAREHRAHLFTATSVNSALNTTTSSSSDRLTISIARPKEVILPRGAAGAGGDGLSPAAAVVVQSPEAGKVFATTKRARKREAELAKALLDLPTNPHVETKSIPDPNLDALVAGVMDELGVDLDVKFNRLRKVQSGVQRIVQIWQRWLTTEAFDHFLKQIRLASAARIRLAISRIQRVGRGFISRMFVNALKRNLKEQQESERRAVLIGVRKQLGIALWAVRAAANRKQFVLGYRWRKRRRAAMVLQRIWRGVCIRRNLAIIVKTSLKRHRAARIIQCFHRSSAARRRLVVLRKVRLVIVRQSLLTITEQAAMAIFYAKLKRDGAALLITRAVRASKLRYRLHALIYWYYSSVLVVFFFLFYAVNCVQESCREGRCSAAHRTGLVRT